MDAVRRIRDLLILDGTLVIAADSIGGIGPKPADTIPSDARTVAHFALRVPLLEVLCAGARPIAVIDNLCVELDPTGAPMIEEIRRLAAEAGVAPLAVTGSTEENVATQATGIGVTVIGRIGPGGLLSGGSRSGDLVICAGLPLSAPNDEVWIGHPAQVTVAGVVHDALPVGSRGVGWEVGQLAASAGLKHTRLSPNDLFFTASGGPASCVLFSCHPESLKAIVSMIGRDTHVQVVAHLGGLVEPPQGSSLSEP